MPDSSDELTISVKTGISMFSFSSFVGIGSRGQDLADDCNFIRLMSAVVAARIGSKHKGHNQKWWTSRHANRFHDVC